MNFDWGVDYEEPKSWKEGSDWHVKGQFALNIYTLAGPWISLGLHLSIVPLYFDLHIGWWVVSLMSKRRSEWIRRFENPKIDENSLDS